MNGLQDTVHTAYLKFVLFRIAWVCTLSCFQLLFIEVLWSECQESQEKKKQGKMKWPEKSGELPN